MTDTTTLAPTDAAIWREWELILATSNPTAGTAAIKLVRTAIAKWGAPAPASREVEALTAALVACRDAFPAPAPGSAAELDWGDAMGDPLSIPAYVRACVAAPQAQEARVPLDERDILHRAAGHSHPGTAGYDIELARFVESAHGITAAQKETP